MKIMIKIGLHILQPIIAIAISVAVLSFYLNRITVIEREGEAYSIDEVYYVNPFDSSDEYIESEIFRELFIESMYSVAEYAEVEIIKHSTSQGEYGEIDITQMDNIELEPIYYYVEDLMKWGQYTELYETKSFKNLYEVVTYFDPYILAKYEENFILEELELAIEDGQYILNIQGEKIPIFYGVKRDFIDDEAENNMLLELGVMPSKEDILVSIVYYYEVLKTNVGTLNFQNGVLKSVLLLKERYYTCDGNSLYSNGITWNNALTLQESLISQIRWLGEKYHSYSQFKDYSSNIDYYIEFIIEGKQYVYQNEDSIYIMNNPEKYYEFQDNYDKYFKLSIRDSEDKTNVRGIPNGVVKELKDKFIDNVEDIHIYVGLSIQNLKSAERVVDGFVITYHSFNEMKTNIWVYLGIIILGLILWLGIGLYLGGESGKRADGTLRLYLLDRIPTEISLVFIVSLIYIYVNVCYYNFVNINEIIVKLSISRPLWIYVNVASHGLAISLILSAGFFSFLRRVRSKNIWSVSLVRYVCIAIREIFFFIYGAIDKYCKMMVAKEGMLWRVVVPFVLGNILNVAAGMMCYPILFDYGITGFLRIVGQNPVYLLMVIFMLMVWIIDVIILTVTLYYELQRKAIMKSLDIMMHEDPSHILDMDHLTGFNKVLAEAVNSMGNSVRVAVEKSLINERFKTDLITNVSHDIKTPLTSIINYVDLIKRENIVTEPVKSYIEVLEGKTQRLKSLTEDLVEASKISSGNIIIEKSRINLIQFVYQMIGEFEDKFQERELMVVCKFTVDDAYVFLDSRRMFRVMENLFQNMSKYALAGTRIYLSMEKEEESIKFILKNISANPLNINADELMDQFIRGDDSRTTEGSGLGLFIAKSLILAQDGEFGLELDGDLFKVVMSFPEMKEDIVVKLETSITE